MAIYVTNLLRKMSTFYSVQRQYSGTKSDRFFAREEDRMTSMGSNFLCGRPHEDDHSPYSPISTWPLVRRNNSVKGSHCQFLRRIIKQLHSRIMLDFEIFRNSVAV